MKHAAKRKAKLCRIGFKQSRKSLKRVSLRRYIGGYVPGTMTPQRATLPQSALPQTPLPAKPARRSTDTADPRLSPPRLRSVLLFPGSNFRAFSSTALLGLVQALDHGGHNDGQPDGCVHEDLAKLPAFRRRHELAPGDGLAIGTARQSAPIHGLRANPETIVIALQRHVLSQPPVPAVR